MAIYYLYLRHIIDIHAFASQKRMQELWNKDNVHLTVNNCTVRMVCTSRMFVVRQQPIHPLRSAPFCLMCTET